MEKASSEMKGSQKWAHCLYQPQWAVNHCDMLLPLEAALTVDTEQVMSAWARLKRSPWDREGEKKQKNVSAGHRVDTLDVILTSLYTACVSLRKDNGVCSAAFLV